MAAAGRRSGATTGMGTGTGTGTDTGAGAAPRRVGGPAHSAVAGPVAKPVRRGARGLLRIYLGAAPGVGKTVDMLSEGHRRAERGTDVVVGVCETHGRPFTAALLEGLEVVPLRTVQHREVTLQELDVDAILQRRPEVALIDELAHTNAPGSANAKRWQDVEQLLDAGIEVISTVNIQHLESLNDVVESITGVRQRETVPDHVVRGADQVELVDMSPESLRRRMAHGNVYASEKVDAALANYFRPGNLSALRELALLWLADRVDETLERYRHDQGISATWPTRERVVVALTGGPEGETLLRRAAQISSRGAGGELLAVYVAQSDGLVGSRLDTLAAARTLTEELGGTFHSVTGDDVPEAILDFARGVNASQIVLGASRRSRLQSMLTRGVGESVVAGSGDIDVHMVSHDYSGRGAPRGRTGWSVSTRRRVAGWLLATVGVLLLTWLLTSTRQLHDLPLEMLLYLTLTVGCAIVGGLWPAVVGSVACSVALNYYFTQPTHTLTISRPQSAAAVVVFLVVAVAVAAVVHIAARRAFEAVSAQRESDILIHLAHSLLGAREQLPALLVQARDTFAMSSAALVTRPTVRDPWTVLAATDGFDVSLIDSASVRAKVDEDTWLVLVGELRDAGDRVLVSAFASHAAAVLTREKLLAQARSAGDLAKDNRTRTALLAAVSHDLRTPIAAVKAAVSSLRQSEITWSPQDEAELLESIEASADRLDSLVGNLLDMSRLQTGSLRLHVADLDVGDVLKAAVASVPDGGRIRVRLGEQLPPVRADAGLLDRILANILENAVRHSPGRQEIVVTANRIGSRVVLRVVDRGRGVPEQALETIFEPFQRYGDAPRGEGVGLGLAVARGLTEAMEGTATAEQTPGGGLTIVLDLPAGTP